MTNYLQNLTEEERKANLERARIARQEKAEAGKLLFHDFCDLPHWQKLAKKYGVRLPNSYIPSTEIKYIKRALKKLNIEPKVWLEVQGFKHLSNFGKANPNTPTFLEVGLLLEFYNECKGSI